MSCHYPHRQAQPFNRRHSQLPTASPAIYGMPGQQRSWGRSVSAESLSTNIGGIGHRRAQSASRLHAYSARARSVSQNDLQHLQKAPAVATAPVPVPDRYHRAKVSSVSISSLSSTAPSLEVDTASTQTSASSSSSWVEDERPSIKGTNTKANLAVVASHIANMPSPLEDAQKVTSQFKDVAPEHKFSTGVEPASRDTNPPEHSLTPKKRETPEVQGSDVDTRPKSSRPASISVSPLRNRQGSATPPHRRASTPLVLPSDFRPRTGADHIELPKLRTSTRRVSRSSGSDRDFRRYSMSSEVTEPRVQDRQSLPPQFSAGIFEEPGINRDQRASAVAVPVSPLSAPMSPPPPAPGGSPQPAYHSAAELGSPTANRSIGVSERSSQTVQEQRHAAGMTAASGTAASASLYPLQPPAQEKTPTEKRSVSAKLKGLFKRKSKDNSDAVSLKSKLSSSSFSLGGRSLFGSKRKDKDNSDTFSVYSAARAISSSSQDRGRSDSMISSATTHAWEGRQSWSDSAPASPVGHGQVGLDSMRTGTAMRPRMYGHARSGSALSTNTTTSKKSQDSSTSYSPRMRVNDMAYRRLSSSASPKPKRESERHKAIPSSNPLPPLELPGTAEGSVGPDSADEGSVDLAVGDTVFPRSLDDEGIATIRNAVAPVGSVERKLSRRSSRRSKKGDDSATTTQDDTEDNATGPVSFSFGDEVNLNLNLDLECYLEPTCFDKGDAGFASTDKQLLTPKVGARTVSFSSQIAVFDTYARNAYDRRPEPATCNRLTPTLAQKIKQELNNFKLGMEVHKDSRAYTHFF